MAMGQIHCSIERIASYIRHHITLISYTKCSYSAWALLVE